jgi:hypothetical protein
MGEAAHRLVFGLNRMAKDHPERLRQRRRR